ADQQRTGEAAQAYREAANRNPRDATAWQALAVVEQSCGNLDAAQEAFERSLSIAWTEPAAVNFAFLLNERGSRTRAIEVLKRCLALFPGSATAWAVLCNVNRDAGDMGQAEAACRRALQLGVHTREVHGNLLFML